MSKNRYLKPALFILGILAVYATVAYAGITGSKHDFSGRGWGSNEICIFCHTPHNAKTVTGYKAPLWNHQVTTATYTLYSSPSLKRNPTQPNGPSKLCLSCHDGTVAIDSFGNQTGTHFATGQANLGTNLSDDHPISIAWDHQTLTVRTNAVCLNCHSAHGGKMYISRLPFYGTRPGQTMECGTCHEPHNKGPEAKMLRMSLAGSAICLYCHTK